MALVCTSHSRVNRAPGRVLKLGLETRNARDVELARGLDLARGQHQPKASTLQQESALSSRPRPDNFKVQLLGMCQLLGRSSQHRQNPSGGAWAPGNVDVGVLQ